MHAHSSHQYYGFECLSNTSSVDAGMTLCTPHNPFFCSHNHIHIVNLLLEAKEGNISDNAVLLTIQPLRVAGRNIEHEFLPYQPPSL